MFTLAIGFIERFIRFVELNDKGDVLFIGETETDFDLNKDLSAYRSSEDIITETGHVIYNFMQDYSIHPNKIGILFDTTQTFLNVMPIDYSEDTNNIHSHILWELSNYYPDNYRNFKINYHKLNYNSYIGQVRDTLVIAVDKMKINLVKRIFDIYNFKIHLTDIDQFAAIKCIREIYRKELNDSWSLVIGCKNNRIDLCVIDEESLVYYDYLVFNNYNFQESLRNTIERLNKTGIGFKRMFLYGDEYTKNVLDFLELNYKDIEIKYSDPFKKFNIVKDINDRTDSGTNGFMYTPLIGLALKGF